MFNMKGGITGQKVKASVKKANSQKAEVKLLRSTRKISTRNRTSM